MIRAWLTTLVASAVLSVAACSSSGVVKEAIKTGAIPNGVEIKAALKEDAASVDLTCDLAVITAGIAGVSQDAVSAVCDRAEVVTGQIALLAPVDLRKECSATIEYRNTDAWMAVCEDQVSQFEDRILRAFDVAQQIAIKEVPALRGRSIKLHIVYTKRASSPCGWITAAAACLDTIYLFVADFENYGDIPFAIIYLVFHEMGHRIQFAKGEVRGRPSIDIELDAHCYAGALLARTQATEAELGRLIAVDNRIGDHPARTHGELVRRISSATKGYHDGDDVCLSKTI